jgi:hypothetical protein
VLPGVLQSKEVELVLVVAHVGDVVVANKVKADNLKDLYTLRE